MQKITGTLLILGGVGVGVLAISLGIAWLALCFGTVIVGIAILLLAPGILFLPFTWGLTLATALIASGAGLLMDTESPQRKVP